MSAAKDQDYFCDGIAEEITNALVRVERLKVAGRTSAFSFKGKSGDLREIGRALDVTTVLEGSVRKAGNRLRITAQIVKVADGYHLWSERYDRQMEDIFEIQDEIALAVVEALKVALLGDEKAAVLKRATEDAEAYRLCLKARHAWHRWTDEGFRTAEQLFQQALEKDPNYALAHFGLGDCRGGRGFLGREPVNLPGMRTLLEAALRLDPDLAEAYAVLGGIVDGVCGRQWSSAEALCRKAVAMNPRSATVHQAYGAMLWAVSRYDEAVELIGRSVAIDPLFPLGNATLAQALVAQGDWDSALRQVQVTLDVIPDYWYALLAQGQARMASGHLEEAVASFERSVRTSGGLPYVVGQLGNALARAGRRDEALRQLELLRTRAASQYVPAMALAYVHAGLEERDQALALLNQAADAHDPWVTWGGCFPALDPLRSDPGFKAFRRRLGLPTE